MSSPRNLFVFVLVGLAVLVGGFLIIWSDSDSSVDLQDLAELSGRQDTEIGGSDGKDSESLSGVDRGRADGLDDRETIEPSRSMSRRLRERKESRPIAFVIGSFVDEQGRAIEGVTIYGFEKDQKIESASDGSFRLEVTLYSEDVAQIGIKAGKEGYACVFKGIQVEGGRTSNLGEVVLEPAGELSGLVVDDRSQAIPDAKIILCDADGVSSSRLNWICSLHPANRMMKTDQDGAFRLQAIPAGILCVKVEAEGFVSNKSLPQKINPRMEVTGIEIVLTPLSPEDCIEGVVLSASGEPVGDAYVEFSYAPFDTFEEAGRVCTDSEGRFRLVVERRVIHHFMVYDYEHGPSPARAGNVLPGETDLVLRFEPLRTGRIDVRTAAGGHPSNFDIYLSELGPERWNQCGEYFDTEEIPDAGAVEVSLPCRPFMVEVIANGYLPVELGPFDPASFPDPLRVTLNPAPGIAGTLTVDGKRPEKKYIWITLHEAVASGVEFRVNRFLSRSQQHEVGCGFSKADGTFQIPLSRSGRMYIRFYTNEYAPAELGPLDFDHEVGVTGLVVNVTRGGSLEGKLILPGSQDPEGRSIGISRGDGFPRTTRTGPGGVYRFDLLTPGPFEVGLVDFDIKTGMFGGGGFSQRWEKTSEPAVYDWACTVREGETTHYDLDLSRDVDNAVTGVFLFNSSAPPSGWRAVLKRKPMARKWQEFQTVSECALGSEGRFYLESSYEGAHWIVFSGLGDRGGRLEIIAGISLKEGEEMTWSTDLSLGRINGCIEPTEERRNPPVEYKYTWTDQQGTSGSVTIRTNNQGFFDLDSVPAGAGSLVLVRKTGSYYDEEDDEVLARVRVSAGETTTVNVD